MESINSNKVKKYLFYVSIVFLLSISSHLGFSYYYEWAMTTPLKWGSISEWIIGTNINLNPFLSSNDENKTIKKTLFRWLMKYNPENGNFEADLASCELKDLKNIECFLEWGNSWSDGTDITTNDVYKTYQRLKDIESNETIYPLLTQTKISVNEDKIIFTNELSDINNIKVLLQPIVNWNIAEAMAKTTLLWNSSNQFWMLYSWPYKYESTSTDQTTWVKSVVLTRNEYFKNKEYHIDKLTFRFFKDPASLLKYKTMVNIFNDTENVLWEYSPRIQSFEYTLPKITSLFINTWNLRNPDLRAIILEKINRDDIIASLGDNFEKSMNPFGGSIDTQKEVESKNIANLIEEFWFYNKARIIDLLLTTEQKEAIAEQEAAKFRERKN